MGIISESSSFETKKVQSSKRYIAAILIGTLVFLSIFFLSKFIAYSGFVVNSDINNAYSYEIFSDKLGYSFFGKDICSESNFHQISDDLGYQGRIIDDMEKKLGKDNKRVIERKKFYTLILLEHYEFVNLFKENCNESINMILFFYSNSPENLDESEKLGKILGYLAENNPDLVIYSFDVELQTDLIRSLTEKYNVTGDLTLVINDKTKLVAPETLEEIEKYLK